MGQTLVRKAKRATRIAWLFTLRAIILLALAVALTAVTLHQATPGEPPSCC